MHTHDFTSCLLVLTSLTAEVSLPAVTESLGVVVLSCRVPDDSNSQSGVIKQRHNCLESRQVEGQELPILTLGPCHGPPEGTVTATAAARQVGLCLQITVLFFKNLGFICYFFLLPDCLPLLCCHSLPPPHPFFHPSLLRSLPFFFWQ